MSADLFGDSSDDGDSLFGVKAPYKPKEAPKQENNLVLPSITSTPTPKSENELPPIPQPQQSPPELPKLSPEPQVEKPVEQKNEPPKPVNVEQPKQPEKPVEQPQHSAPKAKGKKVYTKTDVETSLSQFKKMIQQKFDELQLEIQSFNPPPMQYRHVCLSNEKMLQQVRSIATESAQKNRILTELQSQIDELSSVFVDREERVNLRSKIQQLNKELAEYSQPIDTTALNNNINRLEEELKNISENYKKDEQLERDSSENKLQVAKKNAENDTKRLNDLIKQSENTKKSLEEQLQKLTLENQKLSESNPQGDDKAAAQLKQMKIKLAEAAKGVVQRLAGGTLKIFTGNIKEKGRYPSAQVLNALKQTLGNIADEILNPDDYDEDEEED